MNVSKILIILGMIAVGLLSRLIPHPPNFTSMNAVALFGAFYLESRWLGFATVVASLFLSDFVLGFYPTMSFVYLSFGLIVWLGSRLKNPSFKKVAFTSLLSSCLFFLVTNFGDWLALSLYPKTLQGLGICYVAAIPFFGSQVMGDLLYALLFFGLYEILKIRDKKDQRDSYIAHFTEK